MGFRRGGRAWIPGPAFDLAFTLSGGSDRPKLCFVATASGDSPTAIANFYAAFAGSRVQTSHLALFDMPNMADIGAHLHEQDVIWVDRGSLVNLIAVWRAHRVDELLRECWGAGVVLAGESAGSLCWHTAGTTDAFGPKPVPAPGLGWLPYANAVHYEQELRRASFHKLMGDTDMPTVGYATDAGVGLVYRGTELVEAVTDRSKAGAYRLERTADGVVEKPLPVRRLG
jgi:peptidase E